MKYWNKSKERREFWTKVEGPIRWKGAEAKRWCQQHASTGKFYIGEFSFSKDSITHDVVSNPWIWYFEDPQDALAFKIYWG